MVRITGGKFKGRNIDSADTEELRPTTSFFREWLFNVLNNMICIEDVRLLDLYAGTGIISFEFISRGALSSSAVEKDFRLTTLIRSGVERLSVMNIETVQSDCNLFINRAVQRKDLKTYNVIFADPPYSKNIAAGTLDLLFSEKADMAEDIIIIIETEKDKVLNIDSDFVILKEKSSGTTKMTVIGRKE